MGILRKIQLGKKASSEDPTGLKSLQEGTKVKQRNP
jgi:hypothetical protein